jgi:uncharacterized metal-binding protein
MYCGKAPLGELKVSALPEFCPMRSSRDLIESMPEEYGKSEVSVIYHPATVTEKEAYQEVRGARMAVRPRVKEIVEYARLTGIRRIGIAFCAGLQDEARRLADVLEKQGFVAASVLCKCGAIDKTDLGVEEEHKIGDPGGFEAGCNPILQAELLNRAGTEMNVIVGLCLGHDMLFTKHSAAPVTTFIVKDRLLAHNPAAALYSAYHRGVVQEQQRV